MRKSITVVIPTYNVKDIIDKCLESLRWADEIIIVDMFSNDGSVEAFKKFPNVKVFQRHDYIYGNVNFGITMAAGEWIMRFDSDEVMTEELKQEILEILKKDGAGFDGFFCKPRLFMFGKEVRHGVGKYTHRKQIFRKGYAWYQVTSEHEEMTSKGKWGYLKNSYLHYSYKNIRHFIEKTKYYVLVNAEESQAQKLPITPPWLSIYKCIRFFILFYIQFYGFLDGWHGFLVSFLRGPYYVWYDDKARRLLKKRKVIKSVEKHRDKITNLQDRRI